MDQGTQSAKLLAHLVMGEPAFEELSDKLDVYCPFEALKVARHEIRHSNFLADIIDPSRPHEFGETILRSFINELLSRKSLHDLRLRLHIQDLGRVEILREWKNIDLICCLPDVGSGLVIALEIKVESGEHGNQLNDYEQTVNENWPDASKLFFLLSPNGIEPSSDLWTPVTFDAILRAFEKPLENFSNSSNISAQMLKAYIDMMRRRYVPNDEFEELARQIWQKHGSTLEYLFSQRPNIMKDTSNIVQSDPVLSEIIASIFEKTGISIAKDSSTNTFLRFYVPKWEKNPNMASGNHTDSKHILLVEVEFYGERIHIRMLLTKGDASKRAALYDTLKITPEVDLGRSRSITEQYTRLASKTILRQKNIDESNSPEDLQIMVSKATKGVVDFLAKQLPAYDKAILDA